MTGSPTFPSPSGGGRGPRSGREREKGAATPDGAVLPLPDPPPLGEGVAGVASFAWLLLKLVLFVLLANQGLKVVVVAYQLF
jgi:hypothetical protein